MRELIEAFRALKTAPRALWLVIFAYTFDNMAYFGILPLMSSYLSQDLQIRPEIASTWVSIFTGSLTLIMLFVGRPTEGYLGIRKSIFLALMIGAVGRAFYCAAPFAGGKTTLFFALILTSIGAGILQVVAYAGVKQYTSEATGSMGFALVYAGLNFGAMTIGPISAAVRTSFDEKKGALSGFNAVNITCTAITALTLLVLLVAFTKGHEDKVIRGRLPEGEAPKGRSPFFDVRFMYFIFALFFVRTLFAHAWLTMPEYVLRSYPKAITDRMEWFAESLNPLFIFFGVPILAGLTKRFHVLNMMIIGSIVSACSPLLLAGGPNTIMLIAYFAVYSLGEALWSSRFMEYAAEIAPPGRVAAYIGVAQLPWFIAKTTTGFYSGKMLQVFVPKDGPQHSGTMWTIYAGIALISPVALIVARKWLKSGMAP